MDKKEANLETEKFLKLIEKEIEKISDQKFKNWIDDSFSLSLKQSFSNYFNKLRDLLINFDLLNNYNE